MNQPAKQNPPSRRTKQEILDEKEDLENQNSEQAALIERLQAELAAQKASGLTVEKAEPVVTGEGDKQEESVIIDPVTQKPLKPALSPEAQQAQDMQTRQTMDEMMGGLSQSEDDIPEVVRALKDKKDDRPVREFNTDAKNSPAQIRSSKETDERDTGYYGQSAEFVEGATVDDPKLVSEAKPADVIAFEKKQMNLEFMRQMVTIHIFKEQRREDDKVFSIGVNGKQWTFERNKEYTVPRYVVEGLLRAKPIEYGNEEYTKDNGVQAVRYPTSQGVRYPFAIVADPYPHWKEWMSFTLAQGD